MFERKKSSLRITALFLIVFLSTVLFSTRPAQAGLPVSDIGLGIVNALKDLALSSGSVILSNTLRTFLNQYVYDVATELATGNSGQGPYFEKTPLGERIVNAGDAAFGDLIEEIGTKGLSNTGGGVNRFINLCSPDTSILNKISLGIAQSNRPDFENNNCSFRELKKTWQNAYDENQIVAMIRDDKSYLKKITGYLEPGGSDLAVALNLHGIAENKRVIAEGMEASDSNETKGWLRVENLVKGNYTDPPGSQERKLDLVTQLQSGSVLKFTGNVLTDAANIFMNQYSITLFNKLMSQLVDSDSGPSGSVQSPFSQGYRGGVLEVENNLQKIVEAQFNDRTDYNILGELITCPKDNQDRPGPTNCVITESFSNAISNRMTVIKAIESGFLQKDYAFGFKGLNNAEPPYNQGYPYRSLIILRKYRVLPVGWELAAQYIQKNNKATNPPINTQDIKLGDLINCFDPCDQYRGYNDGTTTGNDCVAKSNPDTAEKWCTGLVDPNWVLKIPQMYCKAEGFGPEIQNTTYVNEGNFCSNTPNSTTKTAKSCVDECSNLGTNYDPSTCCQTGEGECEAKSTVNVTRNKAYCADEQSCIQEKSDGSCAYYGYCAEEKRRWVFSDNNRNQCEAINNTCQNFSGNGKELSLLENTLDFASCGPNQVGCKQYALTGPYNAVNNKIAWSAAGGTRYLNRKAQDCDPENEGCHQFIRAKDNKDTNIIADGSFEGSQCINTINSETQVPQDKLNPFVKGAFAQTAIGGCEITTINSAGGTLPAPNDRWHIRVNSGSVKAGIVNDESDHGSQSIYIEGAGGLYSRESTAPTLLPSGFVFEAERYYTLSVMVRVTAGKVRTGFGSGTIGQFAESTALDAWQNLVVTYYRPANGATDFYIEGTDSTAKFHIDSIKLAIGNAQTSYSDYFGNNVIYQKLLPSYMEAACYESTDGDAPGTDNFQYKANAPEACFKFARKCNADEVGCEQYTSRTLGISVTAKVKPKDICPGSCVGYDVFVEQKTSFTASNSQYFIPQTAKSCSAQAVGCTAFTNLDKLSEGGEAVEYYTYMRMCQKPDATTCGDFYTWEGSDEAGYQLKAFSLKKNGEEPASTMTPQEEALVCNEEIFKKQSNEVGYNHDCREFYGRDGSVSYHLYTRTISCSDDCHPYRREVAASGECTAGGGTWDETQKRCLYYAIPGEGTTCSAPEVGCREYTGNIANNTEVVLNDSFENTTTELTNGWSGGTQSNTSLNLGGHSLQGANPSSFSKRIGNIVTRDKSYTISFLARAQGTGTAVVNGIELVNKDNQAASFDTGGGSSVSTSWKLYTFNLANLDHEVTPLPSEGDAPDSGEMLRVNFSQAVYIDNIKLTEVPNRFFLIKDSWETPDECDQTITGAYSPRYMLGCSQYQNSDNQTVNLHSFSQLCQDSAAGCEQMIDTKNSGEYRKRLYNDSNGNGSCEPEENSCVVVDSDAMINVVYDRTKQCEEEEKGCQRLGVGSTYETTTTYADSYKKLNPDTFNTSLCSQQAVGCEAWTSDKGEAYFKDPGDQACEYREEKDSDDRFGWFKVPVSRCGGTTSGALCSDNSQCSAPATCQKVTVDVPCGDQNISKSKTVGLGGRGNAVEQPTNGWAGICSETQSGCTEYIDPVSKFNNNILLNPSYEDIDKDGNVGDYWTGPDQLLNSSKIEPNTLYILKGAGASITDWGNNDLYQLNPATNEFDLVNTNNPFKIVAPDLNNLSNSTEFFVIERAGFTTMIVSGGATGKTIELRKAIIGYQFSKNMDKSSTTVDFKTGRVLFNERSVAGSTKQKLTYNADQTAVDTSRANPPSRNGLPNANVILKVSPDRTCDKWLACRSYGVNPDDPTKQTCFDVGLCNSMSANGECKNFLDNYSDTNLTASYANQTDFANMTGYTKAGYEGNLIKADMYNLSAMKQAGSSAALLDPSFEKNDGSWTAPNHAIINKPEETQLIASPDGTLPDGSAVMRLGQNQSAESSMIILSPNTKYVVSVSIYNQSGIAKVELLNNATNAVVKTLVTSNSDGTKKKWVRATGQVITGNQAQYKLKLASDSEGVYFDDIHIEAALRSRCDDPEDPECEDEDKEQYIGSSCRLYPESDSLACAYDEQNSDIKQKGWRGYCLEWDPKNDDTCLMWYPVDKIASEGAEEGAGIVLATPFNYCLNAMDSCSASPENMPQITCRSFAQTDNTKYWRTRLQESTSYKVPRATTGPMKVNLGYGGEGVFNDADTINTVTVDDLVRDNNYGAYTEAITNDATVSCLNNCQTSTAAMPLNFFPYYSTLTYTNSASMCMDNRSFSISNVCGGCEDSGEGPYNIYASLCTNRNSNCTGPRQNDGCKTTAIYGKDEDKTRYDDCTNRGFCQNAGCYGTTTDNKGRWGYDAFDGYCDPSLSSPAASCGFYTKEFAKAASSVAQSKEYVKRLFAAGTYKDRNASSWNITGSWSLTDMPRCYQQPSGTDKRSTFDATTGECISPNGTRGSCFALCNHSDPSCTNDYCYVRPDIFNIKAGRYETGTTDIEIIGGEMFELKFNSRIDADQLPLVEYRIDWDGNPIRDIMPLTFRQNGNLYDRPNGNNPHVFATYFGYQRISTSPYGGTICGVNQDNECPGKRCCVMKPEITIYDNWGAYREIKSQNFPFKIIVSER